jgi:hypothetical protein
MSLEGHNIQNGNDYADILIQGITEIEDINQLDTEIVRCWCIEIRKMCIEKYNNYIIGKEETFLLSDEEMDDAYRLGVEQVINETLEDLSDKGMLEISVSESGEVLYGLSEKGKKEAKRLNK